MKGIGKGIFKGEGRGTWWDMEREGIWKGEVQSLGREWEGDEKLMYEEVKGNN